MRNLFILFSILFFAIQAIANPDVPTARAARYKKQFGLKDAELYHVDKKVFSLQYMDKDTLLHFPINKVYNQVGEALKLQTPKGIVWPILTCFESMKSELDTFFDVNSQHRQVVVKDEEFMWARKHVKPVYISQLQQLSAVNIFIYYPEGMLLVKKKYKKLIDGIREHQRNGHSIGLYFVMVEK